MRKIVLCVLITIFLFLSFSNVKAEESDQASKIKYSYARFDNRIVDSGSQSIQNRTVDFDEYKPDLSSFSVIFGLFISFFIVLKNYREEKTPPKE